MAYQIRLLGDLILQTADGTLVELATRKSWALLAVLITGQGRSIARDDLATMLWPKASEMQARASLRQELATLRKRLSAAGLDILNSQKDWITCNVTPEAVDVLDFERGLGDPRPATQRAALDLYRGPFLAGVNIHSPAFEDWLWIERDRLKNRAEDALLTLLEDNEAVGDDPLALQTARKLLQVEPTQEKAYRALMRLHLRAGNRWDALQVFAQCEKVLRRDVDTEPSRETLALAEKIRGQSKPSEDMGQKLGAQSRKAAVLCFGFGPRNDVEVPPLALYKAQKILRNRVEKAVIEAGGHCLPGLGDRHVAVFCSGMFPNDCDVTIELGVFLTLTPVVLGDDLMLRPQAGIAGGEVLLAVPDAPDGAGFLVGEALQLATARMTIAPAGAAIGGSELQRALALGYEFRAPPQSLPEDPAARVIALPHS